MSLEITTVGAHVKYCVETTAGTRPTSGYTEIPSVNQAPELSLEVDALDASDITDLITRYVPGRQDPGGNKEFTLNHTESAITAWGTLCASASTAFSSGKATWFEYQYPGASKSFFFSAYPLKLGTDGISQNQVDQIPAPVIITGVEGWAAKST